jgi:toxin YoeB
VNVLFTPTAWQDYCHWQSADPDVLGKLNALIENTRRQPFTGLGKPEPLKGALAGFWSRRITGEHRLVYRVIGTGDAQRLEVIQCRYHS